MAGYIRQFKLITHFLPPQLIGKHMQFLKKELMSLLDEVNLITKLFMFLHDEIVAYICNVVIINK